MMSDYKFNPFELPANQHYLFEIPDPKAFIAAWYTQKNTDYLKHTPVLAQDCTFKIGDDLRNMNVDIVTSSPTLEEVAASEMMLVSHEDVQIQQYTTQNRWGTKAYTIAYIWDEMPSAIQINDFNGEQKIADNGQFWDALLTNEYPELQVQRSYITVDTTKVILVEDDVIDTDKDKMIGVDVMLVDFVEQGLCFVQFHPKTPVSEILGDTPAVVKQKEMENTMHVVELIDQFYQQGLIEVMTEMPSQLVHRKIGLNNG